ncbi:ATP-binding protein [Anaerospora hongkongensis]|uniref:ATP-binding protein n=1 Tax=Anaerospora hongkongensis TaxID=244830 RepID=UPI0028968AF2|nr:AAA family ATPase [Anaerospora hongkongensis]
MSRYYLTKLYIDNFKLFENVEIEFSDYRLTVLDGPNGFGKTTVFDAIELVLTGQISRISNFKVVDEREGCEDILLQKIESRDTIVKAEFSNGETQFTLARVIDSSKVYNRSQKRSSNWELFDCYYSNDYHLYDRRQILQPEVERLFNEDFSRFYNLFYYIQQEENTFFLKKPEKERMKTLSVLFDTKREVEECDKVLETKKKLDSIHSRLAKELEKKGEVLKSKLEERFQPSLEDDIYVSYNLLLPWHKPSLEWDIEGLKVETKETRNKYQTELYNLKNFLTNYDKYKSDKKNQELERKASDTVQIRDVIIAGNFVDGFEEIENQYKKQKQVLTALRLLNFRSVEAILKLDVSSLTNFVDPIECNEISSAIQVMQNYKQSTKQVSKIITELNETRDKLKKDFQKAIEVGVQNDACPFCGYRWSDYEQLSTQMKEKQLNLQLLYDDSTRLMVQEFDRIYKIHLDKVILRLEGYLNNRNLILDEVFSSVEQSLQKSDSVSKFLNWCSHEQMDVNKYLIKDLTVPLVDISEVVIRVQEAIRARVVVLEEAYYIEKEASDFDRVFRDLFKTDDNVRQLDVKKVETKTRYIDSIFFESLENQSVELTQEIEQLQTKIRKVKNLSNNLRTISNVYATKMREHWSSLIKNVEIPFYVYSGKIIQDYQRGQGIFIRESSELKNIRFVSNSSTDHDAICSLSSGQLSALVIAFTLALNKVYGNRNMNMILIDDPVQTMDDINMASLVELLRNEFSEKQLLISTHEEEVSLYLRYKFAKYGLKSRNLNVKNLVSS